MRSRSSGPSRRATRAPLKVPAPADDEPGSMSFPALSRWTHAAVGAVAAAPWQAAFLRTATRTGGPDDDEDDEVRALMPVLAAVIALAVIFGG